MKTRKVNMYQAEILKKAGYTQKEIAEQIGVSDRMVRYYLNPKPEKEKKEKQSLLEPYKEYITAKLDDQPHYNLILMRKELVALGYKGKMTILRVYAKTIREGMEKKAVIRFETIPALQSQVDWKEAGIWDIDGVPRKVYAFVLLLGYSRRAYVHFTLDMKTPTLLACHIEAFKYFKGITREILYDNMKTAWINRGGVWHVNPALLEFASQCGFEPKRCKVRRPQTKGKVERFIGYLGNNFLPMARNNNLQSLDELNAAVNTWLEEINENPIRDFCESRNKRFEQEASLLIPFIETAVPSIQSYEEVIVSREGTVRFETNTYSVPSRYIAKTLTLRFHPLTRNAELLCDDVVIRSFPLLPKGSRKTDIRKQDRDDLIALWAYQNKMQEQKGGSSKHKDVPVDIRSPSWYENLMTEEAV
jgi:transposase